MVTQDKRAEAIEYFRERDLSIARWEARTPADGPEQAQTPTLTIYRTVYPQGWPQPPGIEVLQNDYPADITVQGRTYPSVTHAYSALSTHDSGFHDRIAAAPRGYDAVKIAEQAPRRTSWAAARLAVTAALLRAKFTQHPQLAQTLLTTGDARIVYTDLDSAYWGHRPKARHELDRPPAGSHPVRTRRHRSRHPTTPDSSRRPADFNMNRRVHMRQ